ncbi:hypothetical protein A8990_11912 [Paenibacillus taihuensis]|uniref:Uncharacterized protein n=1 Tax=Paenibacillus taihuensis TaxID=1156355 RepID=A0A3D9RNY9_9BACL|nr:hypothetical protein [Paenibacillus taihuensis]REE81178.1 hypothetical protein A8990_11912 [Paenibacillus taihuensis]
MTTNNVENTNETEPQPQAIPDEELQRLIQVLLDNGMKALRFKFENDEVDGQVMMHELYGPIFVFKLEVKDGNNLVCGFFMRELLNVFQNNEDPALWMASFFLDLMDRGGDQLLPSPPQNEELAKAVIDSYLVPTCAKVIREEFPDEQVYVDLDFNEEHGPVLEAGFPSISDGNNICAMPIHIIMAHYLLNRDFAEPIIQGLYRIREEHGLE